MTFSCLSSNPPTHTWTSLTNSHSVSVTPSVMVDDCILEKTVWEKSGKTFKYGTYWSWSLTDWMTLVKLTFQSKPHLWNRDNMSQDCCEESMRSKWANRWVLLFCTFCCNFIVHSALAFLLSCDFPPSQGFSCPSDERHLPLGPRSYRFACWWAAFPRWPASHFKPSLAQTYLSVLPKPFFSWELSFIKGTASFPVVQVLSPVCISSSHSDRLGVRPLFKHP